MLRDLFFQACEAMLHNRRRTLITMIGMAWGIATVVLLWPMAPASAGPSRQFFLSSAPT